MNENQRYGALIRAAREAKEWDQDQLGREIGRDKSFVSRWELGRPTTPPEPWLVRAMWRVLGLSMRTQLESLGYLDPEVLEPGVAYVIREDDPRAKVLGLLEGASPTRVDGIADLTRLFLKVSLPAESDINSDNKQDRDQSDSA